jgi:peroxiredoxin
MAWLLTLVLGSAAAAAGPFPLELVEPDSGHAVKIAPGPKALHVVFFATWCSPCTAELTELAELETRWRDSGYRLVLVAVASRHSADRLARYVTDHEMPRTLLFDATGAVQAALKADRLPTHVVFDPAGNERARSGALDDSIRDAVAGLVRGKPTGGHP